MAELIFQSVVAAYILLLSWPGCSHLPLLSITIYLAGFIKCFERVQALRLANTEYLQESMLGSPELSPNYPKFMEEFQLRKSQGFIVRVEEIPETSLPVIHHVYPAGRGKVISEAYDLFQTFKRIFVDLILTFEDNDNNHAYFHHLGYGEAFSTIEIELGFAYDMLYTKAYVASFSFVSLFKQSVVTLARELSVLIKINHWPLFAKKFYPNNRYSIESAIVGRIVSDLSDEDHTGINVCRVESKHLSEYMLHLLVECPVMLPIGIGMIRYRGTCADAMRFFKVEGPINGKEEACHKLLHVDCTEVLPHEVKEDHGLNLHYLTVADSCQV
ncbi:hypothetical protein Tco_0254888 [Tanacetum coccineum]